MGAQARQLVQTPARFFARARWQPWRAGPILLVN